MAERTAQQDAAIRRDTAEAAAWGSVAGAGDGIFGAVLGAATYALTHVAAVDAAQDEWDRQFGQLESELAETA